jgi:hypothetical protein
MAVPHVRSRTVVPVLSVLLVAALALAGYLWLTTVRWQADSATWEAQARDYADRVAAQRAELTAVDAELVAAREQLAAATRRITDLANEKAQLGDRNVASQQDLDQQTRVSEATAVVADALDRCIAAQARLIADLEEARDVDGGGSPASGGATGQGAGDAAQGVAGEVDTLCRQAADAHDDLRRGLEQARP